MTALSTNAVMRPVANLAQAPRVTGASSLKPFMPLRPAAVRRSTTVRAEQQTNSQDSYQVRTLPRRQFCSLCRAIVYHVSLLHPALTCADRAPWPVPGSVDLCTRQLSPGRVQKIEEPVRSNFPENTDSGAQNFGPKQSEADDFLKSDTANPDKEILGTDVGIVDAMRFKGAGDCLSAPHNIYLQHAASIKLSRPHDVNAVLCSLQPLRLSTVDWPCLALWQQLL